MTNPIIEQPEFRYCDTCDEHVQIELECSCYVAPHEDWMDDPNAVQDNAANEADADEYEYDEDEYDGQPSEYDEWQDVYGGDDAWDGNCYDE